MSGYTQKIQLAKHLRKYRFSHSIFFGVMNIKPPTSLIVRGMCYYTDYE